MTTITLNRLDPLTLEIKDTEMHKEYVNKRVNDICSNADQIISFKIGLSTLGLVSMILQDH